MLANHDNASDMFVRTYWIMSGQISCCQTSHDACTGNLQQRHVHRVVES